MDDKAVEFQKKLAIAQIGATAGATLSAVIIAIGISLMALSTNLSFDGITDNEGESQFFQIMSENYLNQGIFILISGLIVLIASLALIIAKIKKM